MTELSGKGFDILAQTHKATADDLHAWLLAKHKEALLDGIEMGRHAEQKRVVALAEDLARHCTRAEASILLDLVTLITDTRDRTPRTPPAVVKNN